ncbi:hypothetical protein GCM10025771_42280 [Niveibacterium umoris]
MRHLAAAILALAATGAFAEGTTSVPKHTCVKPDIPGVEPSDAKIRAFKKGFETYRQCIKAYQEDRKAALKAIEVAAKENQEAFNAASEEFNAFVKEFQSSQDK